MHDLRSSIYLPIKLINPPGPLIFILSFWRLTGRFDVTPPSDPKLLHKSEDFSCAIVRQVGQDMSRNAAGYPVVVVQVYGAFSGEGSQFQYRVLRVEETLQARPNATSSHVRFHFAVHDPPFYKQ
jgi:hypothetical protein